MAGTITVIIGVHKSTISEAQKIQLLTPPQVAPAPLAAYLWAPFDKLSSVCSFAREDKAFCSTIVDSERKTSEPDVRMIASKPRALSKASKLANSPKLKYYLHRDNNDTSVVVGSCVFDLSCLLPHFCDDANSNLCGHYFVIEFHINDRRYVRPIYPFEFTRSFGLIDYLTYKLSKPEYKFSADAGIPAQTSVWLFGHILDRLYELRDANCQVFDPAQFAAPAAMCQAFVSGAIGSRLPNADMWKKAYDQDAEMCLIRDMINSPSTINQENLGKVDFNYRGPIRNSH